MKVETIQCGQCGAPLDVDGAIDVVQCEYCGFQSRIIATDRSEDLRTGPKVAETLMLQVTEDLGVPIVSAGSVVPLVCTEVIATSRERQESFTFIIRSGNATRPIDNRLIGEFQLMLQAPPIHRSTAAAGMTLRIGADGSLSIAVKEKGVDNRISKEGMKVPVVD